MSTGLAEDVRYALRALRRNPGSSLIVIATLAVGIGINAAVFAISGAFLLRGFPDVEDNDRILYISGLGSRCCISYPDFEDLREQSTSFEGMEIVHGLPQTLSDSDGFPEIFDVTEVSPGTFGLIGQAPEIGRDFTPADAASGAPAVAILSHAFWESRYGSDADVLGRRIRLDGSPATIVGVMPQGFSFPQKQALWIPIALTARTRQRDFRDFWFAFGRLRDGVTVEAARTEIETIGLRLASEYPLTHRAERDRPEALTFQEFFIGANENWVYGAMWGAVAFVLLIACANLANLMVARSIGRTREISVRIALGASPARIVRQLLSETVLLSILGGLVGWWLAERVVGFYELAARGPGWSSWRVLDYTMDYRVLAYLAAISIGTGLLFGLAPARKLAGLDVNAALKEGSRGATRAARTTRLSSLLVIAQIALAVVLLAGAGVLVRSLVNVASTDTGIDEDDVLTAYLSLPDREYRTGASELAFYDALEAGLEGNAGIESVALADTLPTWNPARLPYELAGSPVEESARPRVSALVVSEDYFGTLGAALLSGRSFGAADTSDAVPVVIVNRRFAELHWPGDEPLGKQLRLFDRSQERAATVVGVASNVVQSDATRQTIGPVIYLPFRQWPRPGMWVLARASVPTATLAPVLRREIASLDSDLPIQFGPYSLSERLADVYSDRALYVTVFVLFAAIALSLASVGLYAVVAHAVERHTRDIGVRIAIGASARDILKLVVRIGLAPVGVGLALGLGLSLALTRVLEAELVQVSPADPTAYAIACTVLVAAAALGCLIPARRAVRVDPVVALRHD